MLIFNFLHPLNFFNGIDQFLTWKRPLRTKGISSKLKQSQTENSYF